jgi:hypothetical protein
MVRKEDILKDILLKMSYDPSKTLNENIEEQMGEKPWMTPRGMNYKEHIKLLGNVPDLTSKQKHILLDIAAVGVLFIPVVGPFLSLGLELANTGLYYSEGDKYMAGFSLAFALIPGSELVSKIPAVRKLGRDGLVSIIKKARTGGKLTKTESEVVEKIVKESGWISKASKLNASIFVRAQKILKRSTLKDLVYLTYKFSKKYPKTFNFSKLGLTIGGIYYTFEKLAEIYGLKPSEEVSLDITNENEEIIVTDYDSSWDYKKIGNKYYTKKKNSDKWILTSGSVMEAIKTKVFKSITNVVNPNDIENEYQEDKSDIDTEFYNIIQSMTDTTQQNEFWGSREYNT